MEHYEAERDYSLSEELTAIIRISPDKHSRLVMNLSLGTMLSDFPLPLSLAIYENSNETSQFGKGCTLSHKVYPNPSELNKYIIDYKIDVLNLPKETAAQKKMALFAEIINEYWDQTYSGGAFSNIVSELLGMLRFE